MQFPGRPTPEAIFSEKRFDIDAIYEIEHNQILDSLKAAANVAVEDRSTTEEVALANAPIIIDEYIAYYGTLDPKIDRELFAAAKRNRLKEAAPTPGSISTYKWLTIVMLLTEVLFGAIFIVYARKISFASFIPLMVAAILSYGAYLAGVGIANIAIAIHPFIERDLDRQPPRPLVAGILKTLGGLLVILLFTYVRIHDEQDSSDILVIVMISLGIALVAIMCGAIWHYLRAKYDYLLIKMYICQKWQATERHAASKDRMVAHYKMHIKRLMAGR
jgi:uncharacterized membrane protein